MLRFPMLGSSLFLELTGTIVALVFLVLGDAVLALELGVGGCLVLFEFGCHFRTRSSPLMRNHVRGKAGRAQCEICGKSISSMNIHSHMRTHSDHTIDCEYCFRPYAGNGMLK